MVKCISDSFLVSKLKECRGGQALGVLPVASGIGC